MNKPIGFPLAKLLKEKGFNEPCKNRYWVGYENTVHSQEDCANENWNNYDDESTTYYSRPTIADIIMWIYEKHGIWISVDLNIYGYFYYIVKKYNNQDKAWEVKRLTSMSKLLTEAYDAAIEYTLTNLIN